MQRWCDLIYFKHLCVPLKGCPDSHCRVKAVDAQGCWKESMVPEWTFVSKHSCFTCTCQTLVSVGYKTFEFGLQVAEGAIHNEVYN